MINNYSAKLFMPQNDIDKTLLIHIRELYCLFFKEEDDFTKEQLIVLLQTTSNFIIKLSGRICSYYDSPEISKETSDLLDVLVKSKYANFLSRELTELILSFFKNNFQNYQFYQRFFPFIEEYLKNPVFINTFKNEGGLETIFLIPLKPNTMELCKLIFDSVSAKIDMFYEGVDNRKYAKFIAGTLITINPSNADVVVIFLANYLLSQNAEVNKEFIENDGLININNIIVTDEKHKGIEFYAKVSKLIQRTKDKNDFPVFKSFLCLLSQFNTEEEVFIEQLFSFFLVYTEDQSITDCFIKPNDINVLLKSAVNDNCRLLFIKGISKIYFKFNIWTENVVATISKFFNSDFLLANDAHCLVDLCLNISKKDYSLIAPLIHQLFDFAGSENFVKLMCKYTFCYKLYASIFARNSTTAENPSILTLFFTCGLYKENFEVFSEAFCELMENEMIPQILIGIMPQLSDDREITNSILRAFIVYTSKKKMSETIEITDGILFIIKTIKIKNEDEKRMLLDLLANLTHRVFNEELDKMISKHLESVDFYGATEEELSKFAFGISQEQKLDIAHQHLCFPSILYKCGKFTISSHYDMIICCFYAIDKWMEKTGKPITEFPCIDAISRRFILGRHAELILQTPLFCALLITRNLIYIPFFEFTKSFTEMNFKIPAPSFGSTQQSVSFWLMFNERPTEEQKVFRFGPAAITVKGKFMYCNGKEILQNFALDTWIMVFISVTEEGMIHVFINTQFLYETAFAGEEKDECEVGGEENFANWKIGSAIRFFEGNNTAEIMKEVYNKGAGCISISSHESAYYTPETFFDSETGKVKRKHLSANTLPVTTQQISTFIASRYTKADGLFKKIIDLIVEGNNNKLVSDYIIFLICLQKADMLQLSSKTFSLLMSCISNILPEVFTKEKVDSAVHCFTDEGSFFTFYEDPSMYLSATAEENIKLFDTLRKDHAEIEGELPKDCFYKLQRFLISVLLVAPEENEELIINTLCDLGISNEFLFSWMPLFIGNKHFDSYFKASLKYVDASFNAFYITSFLPPEASSKLLFTYVSLFDDCSPPQMKQIMHLCMLYTEQVYAWSTAFSIVIRSKIDLSETTNFEFDEINKDALPEFFLMTSILLAVHKILDEKLTEIINTVIGFINLITQDLTFSDAELFAIEQMLGCGQFSDGFFVFPFAPSTNSASIVQTYSRRRGQIFPDGCQYGEYTPSPIQPLTAIKETVDSHVRAHIPPKTIINQFLSVSNSELIDEIIKDNIESFPHVHQWNSWKSLAEVQIKKFTKGKEIGDSDFETSIPFLEIIQFTVNSLLERIKSKQFMKYFSYLTLGTGMFTAKQGKLILSKIVLNILTECSSKCIYSEELINFITARVLEGWMTNSYTPVLSLMLLVLKNSGIEEIPESILGLLLQGFELVPSTQYHIFVELFVSYTDYIFNYSNASKPSFIILLLDRIIIHYSIYPDSFNILLQSMKTKIEESATLRPAWEMMQMQEKASLDDIINIIEALSNGREEFRQWTYQNEEASKSFDFMRMTILQQFTSINIEHLSETLNGIAEIRVEILNNLQAVENKYIYELSMWKVTSVIVGNTMIDFCKEVITFDKALFFREREVVIANSTTIDVLDTKEEMMVPLSTIFTPAFYHIIPEERSDEASYKVRELKMTNGIDFIKKSRAPSYLVKNKQMSCLLSFSDTFIQKESMKRKVMEIVLNEGKPFDNIMSSSIFYEGQLLGGKLYCSKNVFYFQISETNLQLVVGKIISRLFGDFVFYEGIPLLKIKLDDICNCSLHQLKENVTCINFVLISGVSLMFSTDESFKSITKTLILEHYSTLLSRLPDETTCLSIVNNARLAMKPFSNIVDLWRNGEIDNFSFIACINNVGGRLLIDASKYPIFPRLRNRELTKEIGLQSAEDIIAFKPSAAREAMPHEFFFKENMELLQNYSDIVKWINLVFGPKQTTGNEVKTNFLLQKIEKPLEKPRYIHLMTSPHKLFWHSILVDNFSQPKSVFISDNHVWVLNKLGAIVPPHFETILFAETRGKQIIKVSSNYEKGSLDIIANDPSLQAINIFEISPDALYVAFGLYEKIVTLGQIIYTDSKIAGIEYMKRFMIHDKPTSIALSSAHFLMCVACENNVQRINITTKHIMKPIQLSFKPVKVLIDDYAAEIIVAGEKTIEIFDLDGNKKSSVAVSETIKCAAIAQLPLYVPNRFFVTGHINGKICFWNENTLIKELETRLKDIVCIQVDQRSQRIAFCTKSSSYIAGFFGNTSKPLSDNHAFICAKCGQFIDKKPATCSVCHRFFCTKCTEQKNIIKEIIKKNGGWVCPDCK